VTGTFATAPLPLLAAAGFIIGACNGSFLAVILTRWPAGRSIFAGRSRCDGCNRELTPVDLVPILSFLFLRARCRTCGSRIDARHMMVELAGALVGLVAMLAHPLPMALVTMLFGSMLLILAALDAEHHWLPDVLTLPLIPIGLLFGWLGFGPPLVDRAIGAAAGGLVLWLIALGYRRLRGREGLGGGDPKLLAAIGAWVGALSLPLVLLGAGLLGLVAVLLMRARQVEVEPTTALPLGALMAVAAWPIWLMSAEIHSALSQPDLL